MNISSEALRDYLECGKIYKGASSKKKSCRNDCLWTFHQ